jgi:hypothetical protein
MNIFEIIKQKFARKQATEKQTPRVKTTPPKKNHHHRRASYYQRGRTGKGKAGNKLAKKCAKHLARRRVFQFISARRGRKLIAASGRW